MWSLSAQERVGGNPSKASPFATDEVVFLRYFENHVLAVSAEKLAIRPKYEDF